MATETVAVVPVPMKKTEKKAAPKPAEHPAYQVMIKAAVSQLKERGGSSKAAILKHIIANYKVGDNLKIVNARLRTAINRGVKVGSLKQVKGNGANGSFKLADKKPTTKPKTKKVVAPKKTTEAPAAAATGKPTKKSPKKPAKKAVKKVAKKATKSPAKPKVSTPKVKKTPKVKTPKAKPAKK